MSEKLEIKILAIIIIAYGLLLLGWYANEAYYVEQYANPRKTICELQKEKEELHGYWGYCLDEKRKIEKQLQECRLMCCDNEPQQKPPPSVDNLTLESSTRVGRTVFSNDNVAFKHPDNSTLGQLDTLSISKPSTYAPSASLQFSGPAAGIVGKVIWDDGSVKFEGNMDESAKLFFEHMFKNYADPYCKKKCKTYEPWLIEGEKE